MKGMNEAEKGNGLGFVWRGVLRDISVEESKKPCNSEARCISDTEAYVYALSKL